MRRVYDLDYLERHSRRKLFRFDRRVLLIQTRLDDVSRSLDHHQAEMEMAQLVINLQSYWSNWCRAFYFSTALGAVSRSGVQLISSIPLATEHDALTVAINGRINSSSPSLPPWPSYREPKWFSPKDLVRVFGNAKITNGQNASNVLNSVPLGIDHLRTMRNYFAHRSEDLKSKALDLGPYYLLGSARKPSEILDYVEPGRSLSVARRWILDLQRVCTALTS